MQLFYDVLIHTTHLFFNYEKLQKKINSISYENDTISEVRLFYNVVIQMTHLFYNYIKLNPLLIEINGAEQLKNRNRLE